MSDEKVVINADEYAAMRKELVRLYRVLKWNRRGLQNILEFRKLSANVWGGHGERYGALTREEINEATGKTDEVLTACPIAAKLSEEEGGNG